MPNTVSEAMHSHVEIQSKKEVVFVAENYFSSAKRKKIMTIDKLGFNSKFLVLAFCQFFS